MGRGSPFAGETAWRGVADLWTRWRRFPLSVGERAGVRIPRKDSRIGSLNLVGTRSTASPCSHEIRDAVERVPTIPKRRFMGRGKSLFILQCRWERRRVVRPVTIQLPSARGSYRRGRGRNQRNPFRRGMNPEAAINAKAHSGGAATKELNELNGLQRFHGAGRTGFQPKSAARLDGHTACGNMHCVL